MNEIKICCSYCDEKFQKTKSKSRTVASRFLRFMNKTKVLQNTKKLKNTGILFL